MNNERKYNFDDYKCCVIIPTYNNEKTLQRVIEGVLLYTQNIIIVNDGSTDQTSNILKNYSFLKQISYTKNKGKGSALRQGFKLANSLEYEFAITIDSDGQHFPDDLPVFLERLKEYTKKDILLIGARNMDQSSVPKKSSFGNKFSNFWFWVETGIKLEDTQSGYRLYPLKPISQVQFYTTKFEFEIEVIVKIAWRDIPVENVPVKVLYDESERVSHFRPVKDFTRISILNTWLVLVTFLYIKPRNLLRRLKKKGLKKFFKEDVLGSNESPLKKALSIALGIFLGISPFWGFQGVLAISFAYIFKLNKAISFAFSNISLPPLIPVIVFLSVKMGELILNEKVAFKFENIKNLKMLTHLKVYVIGSLSLAFCLALVSSVIAYFIFRKASKGINE
ncbi:DUF2062 domain-containing protein [Tenacibaculum halocynthiae]|uniref:DUF2062 domain-containing protein n=1 Tax=Tenacibaculum halocynthiae TaxID=1254437 RepID=UPI003895AA9C